MSAIKSNQTKSCEEIEKWNNHFAAGFSLTKATGAHRAEGAFSQPSLHLSLLSFPPFRWQSPTFFSGRLNSFTISHNFNILFLRRNEYFLAVFHIFSTLVSTRYFPTLPFRIPYFSNFNFFFSSLTFYIVFSPPRPRHSFPPSFSLSCYSTLFRLPKMVSSTLCSCLWGGLENELADEGVFKVERRKRTRKRRERSRKQKE